MKNKISLLIFMVIPILLANCSDSKHQKSDTINGNYTVTIYPKQEKGIVSPLLMGFNIVYNNARDYVWQNGSGKVPKLLQGLNAGILRWPAGTVTTYYHWDNLTGQGHRDSWSPSFDPSKNKDPSSFMNLDEYLDMCQETDIEPLIGINMASGIKYNRVNEGIEEAKQLVLHCKQKGAKAKYFYLGNEPYHENHNYTMTAKEYANMVNKYASALKKIDDQIKIIVNTFSIWRPPSKADLSYTKTLISKAGKNIDFIDVHDYWAWGHATYAHWKSQENMEWGSTGMSYRDQRSFYRELTKSLGYPKIDIISLEWNIGPPGKDNIAPTQAEAALMIAEQFTQLIQSGMKIATFWPVSWPKHTYWSSRALLNAQDDYKASNTYDMFKLYKDILGQQMVNSETSSKVIQALSVKSENGGDTLWIYLINKQPDQPVSRVDLQLENFLIKDFEAIGFNAVDSNGPLKIEPIKKVNNSSENFTLILPQYSLTKVTLLKE